MKNINKIAEEIVKAKRKFKKITIIASDSENVLEKLLNHIKNIGNVGHSFEIVIDPDNSETKLKVGWDGDGSDYIKKIKVEDYA